LLLRNVLRIDSALLVLQCRGLPEQPLDRVRVTRDLVALLRELGVGQLLLIQGNDEIADACVSILEEGAVL
jgi:hypothetical protein